jgi:RHH-type proline utilization regulon transcriptional repressor/proline dehydrogenase/delta 1-pyrroline-5-carboxylate dehydrogenase
MTWWSEQMLDWAMAHPEFKSRLFHFVDVFPALRSPDDVVRHLEDYFEGVEVPPPLRLGLELAEHVPLGTAVSARVARRNIERMGRQFIVGETPEEAARAIHRLWRQGKAFTVDLLGEKILTSAQADGYATRVAHVLDVLAIACEQWAPDDHLERDDLGAVPRLNLSIKATALSPKFAPLTEAEGLDQVKSRLRPILRAAAQLGAFINIDVEQYDVKDLTLRLVKELWGDPEFTGLEGGVVVQAYLKDSFEDLEGLIEWSAGRSSPWTVRLVKGAYWDTETVVAAAEGWPCPVFEDKAQTDLNYERCVSLLHRNHGKVKAAFASHNLRSLAFAVASARRTGIPDNGYELQMLYGMAEPIQAAITKLGLRLRIYSPVGELIPGMAYLVRRLLENTSNESFIRHRFAEGRALDELLEPPAVDRLPEPEKPVRRPPTNPDAPGGYKPEPVAEWRRSKMRHELARALLAYRPAGVKVPAFIGGHEITTADEIVSVDPADTRTEVARSASSGTREADDALAAASAAARTWSRTPVRDRAAVLFRAAEWMRSRRLELAALEVFEASKPWKEADADVCEAIDFCEYYGRRMLRLGEGGEIESPPGEANVLRYDAMGIAVVISPWNFPLAIPMGMTSAALVAGNTVILKPAEQTPLVAWQLVRAFRDSGLPDGVLNFLPGIGEQVGAYLVDHQTVNLIAFTGSRAVGLDIVGKAAEVKQGQRHIKRAITEMGGKNAIVVDSDADLDQAVPGVAYSAFGYAGQKCSAASRLIVHSGIYDQTVERLAGAAAELVVGNPKFMPVTVGALIDEEAQRRVGSYVERGAAEGTLVYNRTDVPDEGFFVGPAIVADLDCSSALVTDEIFGPVLSVLKADSFDEALQIANDTSYALTGGVYSRTRSHIRRAAAELRAGNVYINRPITGAVVGRQPFGGYGLSGVGSKAGGPDYLLQFVNPRTITENTLRQGFASTQTS